MSTARAAGTASSSAVLLHNAVLLVQKLHHRQLHPVAALSLRDGAAAQQQVQRLGGDGLAQRLLVLLRAQMGQQVGDDQLGVALVRADVHRHRPAVLQSHHAVQLHGDGGPLILADAAVVVGLEIAQLIVLVERVGLEIQPG